jgi:5-(carboxyamino)imidazole ribonucleotide mutase
MSQIAIVMGSDSDWRILGDAHELLKEFGIEAEVQVLSAHRTPERMIAWGKAAADNGISVIIAGAGGAAHLPGMLASVTSLPVIGVPVSLSKLDGMDSLLSIVQMPAGVPVATVSIDGAKNAALLALRVLGASDIKIRGQLDKYRSQLSDNVLEKDAKLKSSL